MQDLGITTPLAGKSICLVFEHSLSHYTRILQEIAALQEVGVTVQLLTGHRALEGVPANVKLTITPSARTGAPTRNLVIRVARKILNQLKNLGHVRARRIALRRIASEVDLFWVIDYPSLPAVMKAAESTSAKVLYETVDLVPEYTYRGAWYRKRSLAGERRLISRVDGFVTACDSYADYYMEHYGTELSRRPVVRDNMPEHIVSAIQPTEAQVDILFLGSLMFDRPVIEILESIALSTAAVTLTFQGKNHLGEAVETRIAELGLKDRVRVLDPCPPEAIVETASAYDIGVVALRGSDENERRASTSKLFTYMAAGLAVLGSDLPGIARVVSEHQNGVLVDGMSPKGWATAIDTIASMSPQAIDAMKQRSIDAARTYSWEKQRPSFLAEFERALDESKPGKGPLPPNDATDKRELNERPNKAM